jgi:hypothetical protein
MQYCKIKSLQAKHEWPEYRNKLSMSLVTLDDGDKEYCQFSPWVYNKDYLAAFVQSALYHKNTVPALSFDKIRVCVRGCTAVQSTAAVDFLVKFEKKIHLLGTKVLQCRYARNKFLFEGSKQWLISPPMLSLYTLLLRTGINYHTIGKSFNSTINSMLSDNSPDAVSWKIAKKGIENIINQKHGKIFHKNIKLNYQQDVRFDTISFYCNIVGFSRKDCEFSFPYWFKNKG